MEFDCTSAAAATAVQNMRAAGRWTGKISNLLSLPEKLKIDWSKVSLVSFLPRD